MSGPEWVWILSLLGRDREAVTEGHRLLADSQDRFLALLVLAYAYQRQYRWHDAALLQERALRLADTRVREALVRHQIGRRLFNEARYADAAAEFGWACDLYRTSGKDELDSVQTGADAFPRACPAPLSEEEWRVHRGPPSLPSTARPANGGPNARTLRSHR
ncbi:tetratricopeptide (TPR) repeat protein [Arthrobacter bambusae]|nr:tetratricopeptide (TPR) repeat protein [Arthrobacter bambusae]MDQ0237086.1 tetratricopeptide (TPR) repeat protein [Arthrobacter bambusae]